MENNNEKKNIKNNEKKIVKNTNDLTDEEKKREYHRKYYHVHQKRYTICPICSKKVMNLPLKIISHQNSMKCKYIGLQKLTN